MKTLLIRSGIFVVLINSILTIAACTLRPAIPQIRYDNIDFAQAQEQPEPELPVKLVPVPQPLPLPAQLKMARKRQVKAIPADKSQPPKASISDANKAAKVEPSKDGYINAIQNYAFVKGSLSRAANMLNEYARDNDPFSKIGERTIAVEVTSITRASTASFQIRWLERRYVNGLKAATERWTALASVLIDLPRDVETLRKNPLGIYVTSLNWSRELETTSEKPPSKKGE